MHIEIDVENAGHKTLHRQHSAQAQVNRMAHHLGIAEIVLRAAAFNLLGIDIDDDRNLDVGGGIGILRLEPAEAQQDRIDGADIDTAKLYRRADPQSVNVAIEVEDIAGFAGEEAARAEHHDRDDGEAERAQHESAHQGGAEAFSHVTSPMRTAVFESRPDFGFWSRRYYLSPAHHRGSRTDARSDCRNAQAAPWDCRARESYVFRDRDRCCCCRSRRCSPARGSPSPP